MKAYVIVALLLGVMILFLSTELNTRTTAPPSSPLGVEPRPNATPTTRSALLLFGEKSGMSALTAYVTLVTGDTTFQAKDLDASSHPSLSHANITSMAVTLLHVVKYSREIVKQGPSDTLREDIVEVSKFLFTELMRILSVRIRRILDTIHPSQQTGLLIFSGGHVDLFWHVYHPGLRNRVPRYPIDFITKEASHRLDRFTILFYAEHDHDLYALAAQQNTGPAVESLFRLHPNLFQLHCSPQTGDDGSLRRQTVIVPHDPSHVGTVITNSAPFDHRRRIVLWRGATTGGQPYNTSDRYRMVDSFVQYKSNLSVAAASILDVAFNSLVQDVQVPATHYNSEYMSLQMLISAMVHLDVDGNVNSWEGLRWKIMSGMAVVKVESSGRHVQWYYRLLEHGTHVFVTGVDLAVEASLLLLTEKNGIALKMSEEAHKFGQLHLTYDAMLNYWRYALDNVWQLGMDEYARDWRIRGGSYRPELEGGMFITTHRRKSVEELLQEMATPPVPRRRRGIFGIRGT